MTGDAVTVLRKELLELVGNRHSLRGALAQGAVMIALCGILVPALQPSVWERPESAAMLYLLFPSVLATVVAADAFAGERERRTLETLLATPVSDASVLAGKAAAAVCFATAVSLLSIACAVVTLNLLRGPFAPAPELLVGLAGGALGASLLSASVTIAVSVRMSVARSAQQMASLVAMGVAVGAHALLERTGVRVDWRSVLRTDAALLLLGLLALGVAWRFFRRDRLFDER